MTPETQVSEKQKPDKNSGRGPDLSESENKGKSGRISEKFIRAGIISALSFGCLFGAIILYHYARSRSFYAVPINLIHVHSHVQVFGWVGLMVMGLIYLAYPKIKETTLPSSSLANRSFVLLTGGMAVRVFAQSLLQGKGLVILGVASGILEVAAISFFLITVFSMARQSGRGLEAYDKFIFAGLISFLLTGLFNPLLFYFVSTISGEKALVSFVATWFFPYRELQMVFSILVIFGINLALLPNLPGAKPVNRARSLAIFFFLAGGLILEMAFYLLMRFHFSPPYGMGLEFSFLLLLAASLMMARESGVFSFAGTDDPSVKFLKASYVWLVLAFFLLAFFPFYNRLTGQAFSHAFFGGYRHALTVGFISLMIMGISSRLIPQGIRIRSGWWGPLNIAFVLLNLGNILRVSSQIATDHFPWAYPLMGLSGFIEVAAFAFWGVEVWQRLGGEETEELLR